MIPSVGDTITSQNSGFSGTIIKIIPNKNGSFKVYIRDEYGNGKWTTI